jgi:alkaline phosphatase D
MAGMATRMPTLRRRDFLRFAAITVAVSAAPKLSGCSHTSSGGASSPEDIDIVFPQGVASGDPRPDSVVLWTRVASSDATIRVAYEVALDEGFGQIVAEGEVETGVERDGTVKLKPVGLDARTTYYYRFIASGVTSMTGRTKTAPAPGDDVPVRFAFASCQDFVGRYYHAWQAFVEQGGEVDFVVYLGDYVYETTGDPDFQTPDPNREVVLPDGLPLGDSTTENLAALTLADYRQLYKTYRSDPWLKRAQQLFPFVVTWDDHEFANDCWQDHATDFNELRGDEKSTARREAANQAFFEYQPADVVYDENASFPNDIRVYRSLRYGRHVELMLVDGRLYRSDHVVPEGPVDLTVGKFSANSSLGSRNFVLKPGFDEREAAVLPTLLGATQKAWLQDALSSSDATWKILGSDVQLSQMLVDLRGFELLPEQFKNLFYFSTDQWDGYRSERAELLRTIAGLDNVVAIAGDIHAFYASELYEDFDDQSVPPVAVEFVCAGISSSPVQEITQSTVDGNATLSALGLGALVPRFDEILTQASPQYRYAKSLSHGIAIMDVQAADAVEVEFLQIADVRTPEWDGSLERVRLRTTAGSRRVQRV